MDEVVLIPVRMLPGDVFIHPGYGLCTVKKIGLLQGDSPLLYVCENKIADSAALNIVHLVSKSSIFPSHIVEEGFVRRELFKRIGALTDPRDLICLPGDKVTFKPFKTSRRVLSVMIDQIEGHCDSIGRDVFNYLYIDGDKKRREIPAGSIREKTPFLGLELLSPEEPQDHCSFYEECVYDCKNDRCSILCNRK